MKPHVSRVEVNLDVAVPFSEAEGYADDFLSDAERRGFHVHVPLRDLLPHVTGKIRKPVQMVFARHGDELEQGRLHDAMLIEWTATGTRLFPQFHGTLRLRIAGASATRLTLEGAYRPPLGRVGRVFDRVIGRRIARATMRELLDRVAGAMEAREADYRAREVSGISA